MEVLILNLIILMIYNFSRFDKASLLRALNLSFLCFCLAQTQGYIDKTSLFIYMLLAVNIIILNFYIGHKGEMKSDIGELE